MPPPAPATTARARIPLAGREAFARDGVGHWFGQGRHQNAQLNLFIFGIS
jgi:hypothetical protein